MVAHDSCAWGVWLGCLGLHRGSWGACQAPCIVALTAYMGTPWGNMWAPKWCPCTCVHTGLEQAANHKSERSSCTQALLNKSEVSSCTSTSE